MLYLQDYPHQQNLDHAAGREQPNVYPVLQDCQFTNIASKTPIPLDVNVLFKPYILHSTDREKEKIFK